GIAIGLGAAGNVFQAIGQTVGENNVADRAAARVGVPERESDDVTDDAAALVGPFVDEQATFGRLRPQLGALPVETAGAAHASSNIDAVDAARDRYANCLHRAAGAIAAAECFEHLPLRLFHHRLAGIDLSLRLEDMRINNADQGNLRDGSHFRD